jgi:hypothetical protein
MRHVMMLRSRAVGTMGVNHHASFGLSRIKFCVVLLSTPRNFRNGTCIYATVRQTHFLYKSLYSSDPIFRR